MKLKSRRRGRPKINNTQRDDAHVNLDLVDKLLDKFKIKHCSVKLTPINIEQSAMDETSPSPVAPKRRGRKPKNALLAAKIAQTPTKNETADSTKPDEKNDNKTETDANESVEKVEKIEKPEKLSLTERKQARKAQIDAIIASGGRGKRTPKPNPKYMDEPVVSATKHLKDELDLENVEGEDGDDEMNLSSDDQPRNEGPLKKRMLQKVGIKSGPGRKPGSGKGTPGRKPGTALAIKRKLEVDIDIDDEHGKQLFLDAKRRFQNSPSGSDEEAHLRKSKSPITDVLAAKLRSKYPNEFALKRTITADHKIQLHNRARLLERSKLAIQKGEGGIELRKRNLTEETETSEDDFGTGRGASDQEASSPKNINRRKTQHTKILSDDKIVRPSSSAMAAQIMRKQMGGATIISKQINKSPLTQNQLSQSKFQGATKTYSILPQSRIIGQNKPAILRQPPRILNSTLCKPTNKATVPSLVTKVVTKDDYEHELNKKRNNNIISSRSKENNVTSYVYTEKDGKMIPKKTVVQLSQQQKFIQQRKAVLPVVRTQSTQQRIISEPVSLNIPNSRRIRKITCYETWYVIKMAEEQPKLEKSVLNLSLMQIGNEIKKIELPSNEWTYKILLQPLNKQLLEMRKTKVIEKIEESKSKSTEESKLADEKTEETTDSDKTTDTNQSGKAEVRKKSKDSTKEETSSPETDSAETSADAKKPGESDGDEKKDEEKTEENTDEQSEAKTEEMPEETTDEKSAAKSEDDEAKETTEDNAEVKSSESSTEEQKEKKSEEDEKNKAEEKSAAQIESSTTHDIYSGEVHDPNINPDDRDKYRPINIMFRRKCTNPNIRIQFDRTVILKNQTFYLNVDGKNVRLVASPQTIETYEDIKTLLQIVNDISLKSCCVELATHIA